MASSVFAPEATLTLDVFRTLMNVPAILASMEERAKTKSISSYVTVLRATAVIAVKLTLTSVNRTRVNMEGAAETAWPAIFVLVCLVTMVRIAKPTWMTVPAILV